MPFLHYMRALCLCYAAPVFHYVLPAYLSQELERVQKRAMRIICPGVEYQQALALLVYQRLRSIAITFARTRLKA